MKYIIKEYYRNIPDIYLIKDLRKTARKLKKNWVTSGEYDSLGKYDSSTLVERFGSWNNALLKAGLQIRYHRIITKEDLMRNLKNVWDKLRRQPKYLEMLKPLSDYSFGPYIKRYGSWPNTLKAFSKWVNKGKKITEHPCLIIPNVKKKTIKRRHIKDGLRYKVLKRDKFKCVLCGKSPVTDPKIILHIDHIKPISKGGSETMKNLRTLCSECNLGKMTGE